MTISTGGTKLTDRGVGALVEGCEALEILELVEVQGNLSCWSLFQLLILYREVVQVSMVQCRAFAYVAHAENRTFGERPTPFLDGRSPTFVALPRWARPTDNHIHYEDL
jgi:hypothetical protein